MAVLIDLLQRVPCDTGTVQARGGYLAGILDGPETLRFEGHTVPQDIYTRSMECRTLINGIGIATNPYSFSVPTVTVPIHQFSDLGALEKSIARALVLAAGGRSTDVHAWCHLPPLTTNLWRRKRYAEAVLAHPKTWHELYVEGSPWIARPTTVTSPANFAGAEVILSPDIPENTTIWMADRQNIGTLFVRSIATPDYSHYRCGLMLNAGSLAVIRKVIPGPKNVWEFLMQRDDFLT